jgi:nicotinamidase-related amidase
VVPRFSERTALLVIDVQKGHDDPKFGRRNNPQAEARIAALLDAWRRSNRPVIHVQHHSRNAASPFHPTRSGSAIKDEAAPRPGEPIIQKHENSAFIGTNLESFLRERGIDTLVCVGLTTPHCVSTTARMAGNLGFRTFVVADATAANDGNVDWSWRGRGAEAVDPDLVHAISLATLHGEFATVLDSQAVLQSLSSR